MKKVWLILFLIAAGAGAVFFMRSRAANAAADNKPSAPSAVNVITSRAEKRNVPVWLNGIGTVQASNTVTVRPRVSGALEAVNFKEGSMVKEGDVLAKIDPRPYETILAQAEAKKLQDEAQLANARLDAARFNNLFREDAASKQQADQANASVSQLEALVKADEAAIEAAKLDLEFTEVRSPISGRTGVRLVDAGNLVTANQGEGLVVVTRLQPISVIFTLPQRHLAALSDATAKGTGRLKVEALDDSNQIIDSGELELVDNQIDPATGTLKLKASFPNENLRLWPGQFVTARVLVNTINDAIVIPNEAIQPGLDGQFCYVVKADSTVEARMVKPGIADGADTVVESGIQDGETIVTTGQSKLSPGMKVAAQQPVTAP